MINLPVDEAYAFDYLTILKIKSDLNPQNAAPRAAYETCLAALRAQLGERIEEILASPEYQNLLDANQITFDAVDRARNGGNVTAKEVDDCNMQRFYCKVALQKRFFGDNLVEAKISK
jgi:hypothetical protein